MQVVILTDMAQVAWSRTAGPYRIATELRNKNFTVQVIDHFLWMCLYDKALLFKILAAVVTKETLCIGFSITFFQQSLLLPSVRRLQETGISLDRSILKESSEPYTIPFTEDFLCEFRDYVKSISPNIKIVLGGALRNKTSLVGTIFDHQFVGFSDDSFPIWLLALKTRTILFGEHRTGTSSRPSTKFDSYTIDYQKTDLLVENERLPIEISRGCIFNCKFCGFDLKGKKKQDHVKDPIILRNELLRNYENWGITSYWFSDDTFNDSPDKVKSVCSVLTSLPFKVKFRAYLRLDLLRAHPGELDLLEDAGLETAMFGIESLNADNLRVIGKGLNPDLVLSFMNKLWHERGWKDSIFVLSCFLYGLPYDTLANNAWLKLITSSEYPSDWINLNPLYLTQTADEFLSSEFDRNPLKYGYSFDSPWNWRLNTGLTFADAQRVVSQTLQSSQKNVTGVYHEHHVTKNKAQLYQEAETLKSSPGPHPILSYLFDERLRLIHSQVQALT